MPAEKKETFELSVQPNADGTHLVVGFDYKGAFVPVEAYQNGYIEHLVQVAESQSESK